MKKLDTNFWSSYFKVYDFLNLAHPYVKLINSVINMLSKINNQNILDAGSGTGNLSIKLSVLGGKIYSLDNSKEGLEIHLSKDRGANIYLHDLSKPLPFEDNFFDSIISLNTICFIKKEDREKIFFEFYRVLKNKGKLIVVNLLDGFKPYKIFLSHIRFILKNNGFFVSLKSILSLLIPIFKIFYYSKIIQKSSGKNNFFNIEEQFDYLEKNGFRKISKSKLIFANQAILNEAYK